jgi:hypothetical protein
MRNPELTTGLPRTYEIGAWVNTDALLSLRAEGVAISNIVLTRINTGKSSCHAGFDSASCLDIGYC